MKSIERSKTLDTKIFKGGPSKVYSNNLTAIEMRSLPSLTTKFKSLSSCKEVLPFSSSNFHATDAFFSSNSHFVCHQSHRQTAYSALNVKLDLNKFQY